VSASLFGFLLTIAVLVWVHEYGHYRAALACGVRVLRFSIGFGPVLFSRRRERDGCEFVVSLLPLGGYVRMLDEREGVVAPQDVQKAFNRRPLWQRSVIVAAGPLANFALAAVLYLGLNLWGVTQAEAVMATPEPGTAAAKAGVQAGDRVLAWSENGEEWQPVASLPDLNWQLAWRAMDASQAWLQLQSKEDNSPRAVRLQREGGLSNDASMGQEAWGLSRPWMAPIIQSVLPDGAAAAAGLQAGDLVLTVRGQTVADADALRQWIRSHPSEPVDWTVRRGGAVLEVTVTPQAKATSAGGLPQGRVGAMIGADPSLTHVRWGPWDATVRAVDRTWELTALSARLMARMVTGELSWSHLSGPLTIADVAGRSVERGPVDFVGFLALVSVSLGLMNLFPLPMLDGGHLMYHLYEWLTGRPVPDVWLERLQRLGMVLLLVLMAVALFNDLSRWTGRL